MCGLCGFFEPGNTSPVPVPTLKAMADTIRHRGPDDEGFYSAASIGLAFRRLSIIDVSGGHQPLSNEDGTVWIVFNGEIYNFEELNRQYLSGHVFKTRCDTETIVHLYEELGEACFAQLRGMFSLALWDARKQQVLLARDRVGKKPMFYSWNGRRLVFGSEIKALFPAGGFSKEIDLESVSDFFSQPFPRRRRSIGTSGSYVPPTTSSPAPKAFVRSPTGTSVSIARRICLKKTGAMPSSRSIDTPCNRA
jgi:asparagine synthase (glutamine-hydrolysing)